LKHRKATAPLKDKEPAHLREASQDQLFLYRGTQAQLRCFAYAATGEAGAKEARFERGVSKRDVAYGWSRQEGELMTAKKGNGPHLLAKKPLIPVHRTTKTHEEAFLWGKNPISS